MWGIIIEILWQWVRAISRGRVEAQEPAGRFFLARAVSDREELVLRICDAVSPDGVLVLVFLGLCLLCICFGRVSVFSLHLVMICVRRRVYRAALPLIDRPIHRGRDAELAGQAAADPVVVEDDEDEEPHRPPAGLAPPPQHDALEDQRRRIAALHPPAARRAILNDPIVTRRSSRHRPHRRRNS